MTDGKLFNPKALFENSALSECARLHMNSDVNDNIIADTGRIQSALVSVLPQGTQFYVNAMKEGDLYNYEDTAIADNTVSHNAATSEGDCLTYSAVGGTLQSAGVDCQTNLMPLCFREIGKSDLSFLNKQCSECSETTATPSCHQWVDLEDYFEEGDDFTIKGVEICTKPCGPPVTYEDTYCQVGF